MKRIIGLAAIVAALTISAAPALASPSPVGGGTACNTSGTELVNVHYTLTNDYDSAIDGHAWANDTVSRQLQIWALDSGAFCVAVSDQGSIVTFPAQTPERFQHHRQSGAIRQSRRRAERPVSITSAVQSPCTTPTTARAAPSYLTTSAP